MTRRRLGLVGGTSWVSSEHYYRRLNEQVAARFGGSHSAPVTLLRDGEAAVPLLDTTEIHCLALAEFIAGGES